MRRCAAASDRPLPAVWISLYYVAFYVVMTGLFALCIYSLMCTLDPYTPDYQDQLKSPGNGGEGRCSSLHIRTPRRSGRFAAPKVLSQSINPQGMKPPGAPSSGLCSSHQQPRGFEGYTRVRTAPQLLYNRASPIIKSDSGFSCNY